MSDRAKPVAEVGGKPFLAHLLARLEACPEIDSAVLCVGHKADSVEHALGSRFGRLPLVYSRESRPLGTGGALRLAASRRNALRPALAMNGDSFLSVRYGRLIAFHRRHKPLVTVALVRVPDAARYGAAQLDRGRVVAFHEKGRGGPAWINGGIYVLSAQALRLLAAKPAAFSFEREALAQWCAAGRVRGLPCRGRFIDIGTPADYARSSLVVAARSGRRRA